MRAVGLTMKKNASSKPWYGDGLKFSCTQCGNCCTGPPGYVWFTPDEGDAMAAHLGLDPKIFLRRYAHQVDGRWTLNEQKTPHGYDCVFLDRTNEGKAICGLYRSRPTQCRTWPFWPENTDKASFWRTAAKTCPGIDHGTFYPADQIRIILERNPA